MGFGVAIWEAAGVSNWPLRRLRRRNCGTLQVYIGTRCQCGICLLCCKAVRRGGVHAVSRKRQTLEPRVRIMSDSDSDYEGEQKELDLSNVRVCCIVVHAGLECRRSVKT